MFNIAFNTFRELVRSRILALILFVSAALIAFSLVLASLSLGQSERLVLDFGLSMIELSGLVAVVFVGGQMLWREIEGRTIYLILSKPVGRKAFVLGKFLGFSLVLAAVMFTETAVLSVLLLFKGFSFSSVFFAAAVFSYVKLLVTFAIALFFSTFVSPMLSVLFSVGLFVASHSANAVIDMAEKAKNVPLTVFGKALTVGLPNFEALSFPKNVVATSVSIPIGTLEITFLHAVTYLALVLLFAALVFERKNFENA